jgi:NADPH:quinone reductase-like Zn-dependent oxidoreductase
LQDVAIVPSDLAAHVPQHYSLAQASTLPVTALTVFAGFYEADWPFPEKESSVTRDEPVLVWGGGSGVGQAAISLLKLAGYTTIITTAAGKREGYLKARGATHVIDYKSPDLAARVGKILGGKPLTKAIDAISTEETSAQVVSLLSPGASLIYVLPDGSLAKRPDVSSKFVFCGMFHNVSIHCYYS